MENLLQNYAKEIGHELTLDELIASHREFRQRNKIENEEFLRCVKIQTEARVNDIIDGHYVKWEDLAKMTLSEIIDKF